MLADHDCFAPAHSSSAAGTCPRRSRLEMRYGRIDDIALPEATDTPIDVETDFRLREIMAGRSLTALFQPIVDLRQGVIGGYEGSSAARRTARCIRRCNCFAPPRCAIAASKSNTCSPVRAHRRRSPSAGRPPPVSSAAAPEDLKQGGYVAEDRRGERVFIPLVSLSIGVVQVEPRHFSSHHRISAAAAVAKREAKKIAGNSLFVERRERSRPSSVLNRRGDGEGTSGFRRARASSRSAD